MIFRELRPHEYVDVPAEALDGYRLPDEGCRVFGAFDGDRLVGMWALVEALHAEPVWVAEGHRRSPTILRRLWGLVREAVRESGARSVVSVVLDSRPQTIRLAEWVGARPIAGKLYLLKVGEDAERLADGVESAQRERPVRG